MSPNANTEALLDGPSGKPPSGVHSNLVNPPNLDAITEMVIALSLLLGTVAVSVRMYTRFFLIRYVAYDDYVTVLAWLGQVGSTVPAIFDYKVGGGKHIWDIRLRDCIKLLYWYNISCILYGIVIFLVKLSILLQYLRIFVPKRTGDSVLFITIHSSIWISFLFYSIFTFFNIFFCNPREKIWNLLETNGHCFNRSAVYMATGIFSVVSDFSILLLPIRPIWKLQMPRRKKVMILAIFATGLCACAISILRTYYTWKIVKLPDISYNLIILGLWTWAEVTIGIIVSCLPSMPKFFSHLGGKIYKVSLQRSKPGSDRGRGDGVKNIRKETGIAIPSDGHASRIEERLSYQKPQQKGKYIALEEYDVASAHQHMPENGSHVSTEGHKTKRAGLEALCYPNHNIQRARDEESQL